MKLSFFCRCIVFTLDVDKNARGSSFPAPRGSRQHSAQRIVALSDDRCYECNSVTSLLVFYWLDNHGSCRSQGRWMFGCPQVEKPRKPTVSSTLCALGCGDAYICNIYIYLSLFYYWSTFVQTYDCMSSNHWNMVHARQHLTSWFCSCV